MSSRFWTMYQFTASFRGRRVPSPQFGLARKPAQPSSTAAKYSSRSFTGATPQAGATPPESPSSWPSRVDLHRHHLVGMAKNSHNDPRVHVKINEERRTLRPSSVVIATYLCTGICRSRAERLDHRASGYSWLNAH